MAISPELRDLVIRTIIGEAGGEGPSGWAAVANVIKNRALSGAWGDPYTGGGTAAVRAPRQFAIWNPGNKNADLIKAMPASDARYQRIGQVVDNVFSDSNQNSTGGATHYYAPSGMKGGPPDWASRGKNVRMIGNQIFMTVPLDAGSTAGTMITGAQPAAAAVAPADPQGVAQARAYLRSMSAHPGRAGDTDNLNPQFAANLAAALQEANAKGMKLTLESGFRAPHELVNQGRTDKPALYDAQGLSSHSYGVASDIGGLDGANGVKTRMWAQIAAAHGLSNPYGVGNAAEYNHWQYMPDKLEDRPMLRAQLADAVSRGDWATAWKIADAGRQPGATDANAYPPSPIGPAAAHTIATDQRPDAVVNTMGSQPGSSPAASTTSAYAPSPLSIQNPPAASGGAPGASSQFGLETRTTPGVVNPAYVTTLNLGGAPINASSTPQEQRSAQEGVKVTDPPLTTEKPASNPDSRNVSGTPLPPRRPPEFGQSALDLSNPPQPPVKPLDQTAALGTQTLPLDFLKRLFPWASANA